MEWINGLSIAFVTHPPKSNHLAILCISAIKGWLEYWEFTVPYPIVPCLLACRLGLWRRGLGACHRYSTAWGGLRRLLWSPRCCPLPRNVGTSHWNTALRCRDISWCMTGGVDVGVWLLPSLCQTSVVIGHELELVDSYYTIYSATLTVQALLNIISIIVPSRLRSRPYYNSI